MKRQNIVVSSLALMVSIALMVFGVYSAGVASLSVTGAVSYTVTDAKVLVQGKVLGASDREDGTYPAVAESYSKSTKVYKNNQYLDYTVGGGVGNANDDLKAWELGNMQFAEDANGITPIRILLKFTNYSAYDITASLTFNKTDSQINASNITRLVSDDIILLSANIDQAVSQEVVIEYCVKSDAVSENDFDIGMSIVFEKNAPPVSFSTTDYEASFYNNAIQILSYKGTERFVEIPSTLTYEGSDYPVVKICDNAFSSDVNLRGVFIPQTVTMVSNAAFENCSSLKMIYSGSSEDVTQSFLGDIAAEKDIGNNKNPQDFWDDLKVTLTLYAEFVQPDIYVSGGYDEAEINFNFNFTSEVVLEDGETYELTVERYSTWYELVKLYEISFYMYDNFYHTASHAHYIVDWDEAIYNLTGTFDMMYGYSGSDKLVSDEIYLTHVFTDLTTNNPVIGADTTITFYYSGIVKTCFDTNTMILCYDSKKKKFVLKKAKEVTYEDDIAVWNFDEGKLDTAKALIITTPCIAQRYTLVKFSDGSQVKFVGPNDKKGHRIFNVDSGKFENVGLDMAIGTRTLNNKGEIVTLTEFDFVSEEIEYMNIVTKKHMNCFANGILSSSKLNNLYSIFDNKFVKENRAIRPITDFEGVSQEYYEGLRLAEQPVEVNTQSYAIDGNMYWYY